MTQKCGEAIQLLTRHFWLFSGIVLTVWLPGSILSNFFAYDPAWGWRFAGDLEFWIWLIFEPVLVGAVIYAVSRLKQGERVRYRDAMREGIRVWGRLLVARLAAMVLTGLGFLALIVPGIVLAVRWALLGPAVVLEGAGVREGMGRSARLVQGRGWSIVGAVVLLWVAIAVVVGFIGLVVGLMVPPHNIELNFVVGGIPEMENAYADVAMKCFASVLHAVIVIVLFLFYWEGRGTSWSEKLA